MPADKRDFEIAQEIYLLLGDVANQESKEEALDCDAMKQLLSMATTELIPCELDEFVFRCAIALQFSIGQSVAPVTFSITKNKE